MSLNSPVVLQICTGQKDTPGIPRVDGLAYNMASMIGASKNYLTINLLIGVKNNSMILAGATDASVKHSVSCVNLHVSIHA